MGKCKIKGIQADSEIFTHLSTYSDISRHNQTYSGIIQAYSESCVTLTYSEHWYIQNPGIFRTLVCSEPETYSEFQAIQNPGIFRTGDILRTFSNIIIFASYKMLSQHQLFMSSSSYPLAQTFQLSQFCRESPPVFGMMSRCPGLNQFISAFRFFTKKFLYSLDFSPAQGPRTIFLIKMQQNIVVLRFDENTASGPPMKLQKKLRKN